VPSIEENKTLWTTSWDWSAEGDEWSSWWGGTQAMWFGALLPRINSFLPAGTILELGPGYGRWSQCLKDLCERLVLVDLVESCIDHCRQRFAGASNIEYHVNDGRSLDAIADESVDFAFSFDSLVHAEADVLAAYLDQLARKLTPDGVGFFHHSNIGSYRTLTALARVIPGPLRRPLAWRGVLVDVSASRAESVTADLFAAQCRAAGLTCVTQEKVSWERGHYLIDALSVFTPKGSRWERERVVASNPLFRSEARRMARLYARPSFP